MLHRSSWVSRPLRRFLHEPCHQSCVCHTQRCERIRSSSLTYAIGRTYMYPCDCCCPSSNCCGRCEDPDLPDRVEGGRDADSDSDTYVGSDGNIRKKTAYHDPERAPLLEHDGRVGGGGAAQIARTISVQPMAQPPINSDPTNARDLSNTT
jgi:hypothetical protein